MKRVFQTDAHGLYLYEVHANELPLSPGEFNIPFGAFEDAPPTAPAGQVAQRHANGWKLVEDHRDAELWLVSTGQPYQLGAEIGAQGDEAASYAGIGPIPEWLTPLAPINGPEDDTLQSAADTTPN